VKLMAAEIVADTAYNITAGSLYLACPKITGTQTGTPVQKLDDTAKAIDGADAVTTLNDTDKVPVTVSGTLVTIAYSALKTLLNALYALTGAITSSGLTIGTGKLAGRTTASAGAVEEISVAEGLKLVSTTLSVAATTQTLNDAAGIDWALGSGSYASVTLGGNRTVNAPSGTVIPGKRYILRAVQDGTGGRTLAFNAAYLMNAAPVLSPTAAHVGYYHFAGNFAGTNLVLVGFQTGAL
jgi:hypothetical protein